MNINNNINNNNNSNNIKIVPSSFTEDDELQLKRREEDDDASFQHEKKALNVSLDLFEILEDRYAYEGCNRCMFIFFYFLFVYFLVASVTYNVDLAGEKIKLKNKLLPDDNNFERASFHNWALTTMGNMVKDPFYFGDKMSLMRIGMIVRPTLCNYTAKHPITIGGELNYENYVHKRSRAITYEQQFQCPKVVDSENDPAGLVSALKSKYDLYCVNSNDPVFVPVYSAEFHPDNSTQIVEKQLKNLGLALNGETRSLRIKRIFIETLDPFDHIWYFSEILLLDEVTKTIVLSPKSIGLIPPIENTAFVLCFMVVMIFHTLYSYRHIQIVLKLKKCTSTKWSVIEFILVIGGTFFCILFSVIYFMLPFPDDFLMRKEFGTVHNIEESTTMTDVDAGGQIYTPELCVLNRDMMLQVGCAFELVCLMVLMIKEVSWHSGAGVLTSTLHQAFGDIMDTLFVVFLILMGVSAYESVLFGYYGGSSDFNGILTSISTTARFAFGLYDYDNYVSDGLGIGFEGIGIGRASILKYVMLWLTFLFLTICIVNILIAVISDGYEIHKDNQRLRTKGGETIITYGWHRFLYHVGYQFNAHFRKTQEPIWVKKLRFTSTNEAKLLLKYADVIPDDNLVFDKKLQTKIYQDFLRSSTVSSTKGADDVRNWGNNSGDTDNKPTRKMTTTTKYISTDDDVNSSIFEKNRREFFSRIDSIQKLKQIIELIFSFNSSNNNRTNKKVPIVIEKWSQNSIYNKIWDVYCHTDEVREKKEANKVSGNHVRKVVKTLEDQLIQMKNRQEVMDEKLDKMCKNMSELLQLLKK